MAWRWSPIGLQTLWNSRGLSQKGSESKQHTTSMYYILINHRFGMGRLIIFIGLQICQSWLNLFVQLYTKITTVFVFGHIWIQIFFMNFNKPLLEFFPHRKIEPKKSWPNLALRSTGSPCLWVTCRQPSLPGEPEVCWQFWFLHLRAYSGLHKNLIFDV